jgi:hypothetical protein
MKTSSRSYAIKAKNTNGVIQPLATQVHEKTFSATVLRLHSRVECSLGDGEQTPCDKVTD